MYFRPTKTVCSTQRPFPKSRTGKTFNFVSPSYILDINHFFFCMKTWPGVLLFSGLPIHSEKEVPLAVEKKPFNFKNYQLSIVGLI